jgi:hypothetical protein
MTIANTPEECGKSTRHQLNSPFWDETLAINAYDIGQLGATAFKVSK